MLHLLKIIRLSRNVVKEWKLAKNAYCRLAALSLSLIQLNCLEERGTHMKRLGIIDLGSNSVRLIIMDVDGTDAHHQIENIKETVRLSSGLDEHGNLSREAFQYAAETV